MTQHKTQSLKYRDLSVRQLASISEEDAHAVAVAARWKERSQVTCPECGTVGGHRYLETRKNWVCPECYKHFSVTSGTPFHGRKLKIAALLFCIFLFCAGAQGRAANSIPANLGSTYRTGFQNLSKIREAIFQTQDLAPLYGVIQIDGGYFGGKPRRPRVRQRADSRLVNNRLRNRKASIDPTVKMSSLEPWNQVKRLKRRVVLVMRQLSSRCGIVERTIVVVLRSESRADVIPVIRRYVATGSIIQTDDGNAYSTLSAWYKHLVVRHSVEYSTAEGVNNNQAESFFSRMRRAEYGVYNGMRPQYLAFYAAEFAWREHVKNMSLKEKFEDLLQRIFSCDVSLMFRGYCQGRKVKREYIG